MLTERSGWLIAEGLVNLRDLGGLATESGATTQTGRLLRSESPHSLSESGLRALLDLGIGAVVDLRTAAEREKRPSPLEAAGVRTLHAPIFTDNDAFQDTLVTAADVYCWWLRDRQTGVALALTAIADAPSAPILVHCHAGKDRTGVIVALLLRLAGVSVDDIADDYAVSGVQLADILVRDRAKELGRGMNPALAERIFTVRKEAMVQTMACVDDEHGGVTSLLRDIGVGHGQIERLNTLLLARAWPPAA